MSFKDKDIDSFLDDESGKIKLQSDAELDAFLDDASAQDAGQAPMESNPFMDVAKKAAGTAMRPFAIPQGQEQTQPIQPQGSNPLTMALDAAKQTFQNPQRAIASLRQPSQVAGTAVENQIGGTAGKVAGFATETLLDPASYGVGPVSKGVGATADTVAGAVGKEAMVFAKSLSGVKEYAMKELFNNPLKVLTAMTEKKAGQQYGALKKALGVTEAEEKLIAKAGDRTPGVARGVAEALEQKVKGGEATIGEIIAARRAAVKVAQEAKGSEKYLYGRDAAEYNKILKDRSEELVNSIKEVARSKTRGEFLRLFSRQKSNSGAGDFFKIIGNVASAGLTSPLTTGVATLGARVGYSAAKAVGKPAVAVGVPTGLAAIREYLQRGL